MSVWNPFTWFQSEAPIIEQDVLKFIGNVKTDVTNTEAYAQQCLSYLASQAPTIASDLQALESFVALVPAVSANPEVAAAVAAANLAVTGLNAFAATYNQSTSGGVTMSQATGAIISGYQAVKSAQAAAATAAAKAVSS